MDRIVLVTGADRGLGFSLTKEFLKAGDIVFAGQYMPRWKELEALKEKEPERLTIIPLDVSQEESVDNAVRLVREKTSRIDILVNVAGIAGRDSEENVRRIIRTNALGSMCVPARFLPLMQEGMKRIGYFSSEAGSITLAFRESHAYCMSKAALNMAIRLCFNRLRPEGFTFRIYHPGWVNSYMGGDTIGTSGLYSADESAKEAYDYITGETDSEDVPMIRDVAGMSWTF